MRGGQARFEEATPGESKECKQPGSYEAVRERCEQKYDEPSYVGEKCQAAPLSTHVVIVGTLRKLFSCSREENEGSYKEIDRGFLQCVWSQIHGIFSLNRMTGCPIFRDRAH